MESPNPSILGASTSKHKRVSSSANPSKFRFLLRTLTLCGVNCRDVSRVCTRCVVVLSAICFLNLNDDVSYYLVGSSMAVARMAAIEKGSVRPPGSMFVSILATQKLVAGLHQEIPPFHLQINTKSKKM